MYRWCYLLIMFIDTRYLQSLKCYYKGQIHASRLNAFDIKLIFCYGIVAYEHVPIASTTISRFAAKYYRWHIINLILLISSFQRAKSWPSSLPTASSSGASLHAVIRTRQSSRDIISKAYFTIIDVDIVTSGQYQLPLASLQFCICTQPTRWFHANTLILYSFHFINIIEQLPSYSPAGSSR